MYKQQLSSIALLSTLCALVAPYPFRREKLLGSSFGVPGIETEYDYIVVGGGCAGLTVATRLAEDPSVSVAVLEAGTFYELSNGNLSQIPADDIWYIGKDVDDWHPGIDWGYITEPQTGALNITAHYTRGKAFGGSTARNIMTYHAGTIGSYHAWAEAVNDPSYEFDAFWPYFMKHQNHTVPDYNKRAANTTVEYNASRLGTEGPVSVIYPNWAGAFGTYAHLALNEVGMTSIDGFESGQLIGSAYALGTIDPISNTRDSSETAYLQPTMQQQNQLFVYPLTQGKRILFDENKRATGITVDTQGMTYTLSARREVIVAAGSFASPQLLMVSGIGPSSKLDPFNIPIISELAGVGENMWDHILFGPGRRIDVISAASIASPQGRAAAEAQFNNEGTGILTNPGVDVFGWEKVPAHLTTNFSETAISDLASFASDWPDIEYIFPGAVFGYCRNFVRDQPTDGNYGSIIAALVTPMSRGTVNLASDDMAVHPLIDPKWLTHPTDQEVAIAAFKRSREIFEAPSLAQISIGEEYFPGPQVQTDEQILDLIREALTPVSHAACTCKMGVSNDTMAVVDNKARVYGVSGLRVVDASSFPLLPPGHPMATVYAFAEKLADDIKADYS